MMDVDRAISVVARQVTYDIVADHIGDQWENYPEIGESDWNRVVRRVEESIFPRRVNRFQEAYELLEGRANGDPDAC